MSMQDGWRTLAEPTFGVSENGHENVIPAGARLRLMDLIPDMRSIPGADTALVKTGPGATVAWYVTAPALRFEGDTTETGASEQPTHFELFDDAWAPEPEQEQAPAHEVEAREYIAEQNRLAWEAR